MAIAATLDDLGTRIDSYGKPAWIALIVLSFIVFWPLGLAMLVFTVWSGRLSCGGRRGGRGRGNGGWNGWQQPGSSGNSAFDEYRADTLRRLEEEEKEFRAFLDRLRQAKDKAEFDQFMADRGRRSGEAPQQG